MLLRGRAFRQEVRLDSNFDSAGDGAVHSVLSVSIHVESNAAWFGRLDDTLSQYSQKPPRVPSWPPV
jgi:hypothetical protein